MDEQQLKYDIVKFDETASSVDIKTADDLEYAQETILVAQQFKKEITAYWKEPIQKAHEVHKALTKKRAEMLKPIEAREKEVRGKVNKYLTALERKRQDEQRRLDEERRKKEAREREKLQRRAEKAREKGQEEKAQELEEQKDSVYVPQAIATTEIEKTNKTDMGSMSQKKDLQITITDPLKVVQAVAAGKLPIGIININQVKLKQAIKLNGIEQLDGCDIQEVIKSQFRSA